MLRLFLLSYFCLCAVASAAEMVQYALILGEPASSAVADKTDRSAMHEAAVRVSSAHQPVMAQLRAQGFAVTGSTELFVNAIYITADASRKDELKAIPGVLGVIRLPRIRRSLDRAVQLVNIPAAWNLLNGVSHAGAGIKIGVLDSGIEASHPAFQDLTITPPVGYPICQGSDCLYTNNKIIVARSYVKYLTAGNVVDPTTQVDPATDRPDDNSARDRDGHGTAVAMAAAGVSNAGPSDTITGAAPKAFLANYKVFGSPGLNDFSTAFAVNKALQDAYSDGMDIIVYSSGAPAFTGPLDTDTACGLPVGYNCDPIAVAVDNAVKAGKVVVVAAGNYGTAGSAAPLLQSVTSPAVAPNAIAVGASTNSHLFYNVVTVGFFNPAGSALITYRGSFGDGPLPASKLTAPLSDIASAGDGSGCTTPPSGSLKGTITLIARGNCMFLTKIQNAAAGGAVGVIFTNNPGDDTFFSPSGLTGTTIPSIDIGYNDGQAIRSTLTNLPGAVAVLDPNPIAADSTPNQVASFSSRGPSTGTFAIKPELVAPGTGIYTAGETYDPSGALYSPTGYVFGDGTSFSAPIVAGAAAMVKQAHPTLPATSIRSSIINTASQDVNDPSSVASVLAVGAGKLNAAAAVNNNLVASPATVSFGVITTLPSTQRISLTNIGATPLTLTTAINRRTPENTAKTSIDAPNLTLAPGATGAINFSLTGSKPTPGIYEGLLSIQGAAGPLVIPYVYQVGDGVPYNIISLAGDGDEGNVNDYPSEAVIAFKVLDQFGVPVSKFPVKFGVIAGGGQILNPDLNTDVYGIAYATPHLSTTPGSNEFFGSAGTLTTTFTDTARLQPVISGAVNAASYEAGKPVAAGSYIALFGTGLSDVSQSETTLVLPVVLGGVSVSFDAPGISVPGHLYYANPGQVNVQVPWELAGQTSAQIKVSVGYSLGTVYTLALVAYSPAMFEYTAGTRTFAAALDENFQLVTAANAARQGHTIQLYCNGLGPVSSRPASGDPAPSSPLSQTPSLPVVTIGGQQAQVSFSGLTPTISSLYQVNVVVPNTGTGVQPVTVSIGGVTSKQSSIAVQ